MKTLIENPILKGFNPDPSIIRVGDDYYIATSTFEWFPGVQIFHSTDLINWTLVARPLNRLSQLNMFGNPDSCGVWAPCLSYDNGTFYLVYSNARRYWSQCKDVHNYMVTSDDILGDWSEPTYLNSSGFDPSLFHDDDGSKWIINLQWDHRQREVGDKLNPANYFGGIVMQRFCEKQQKLIGPITKIFSGSPLGFSEGPHIYRRHGYYYLLVAEGGTGYEHAATFARAKALHGPYHSDPNGPILTSINSDASLQRAGHADIVDTPNGKSYMVHLCSRPLANNRSVMGRETALQQIEWHDSGWPRLIDGDKLPRDTIEFNGAPVADTLTNRFDDFDSTQLDINFQTLRIPLSEDSLSLTQRRGYLRLKGKESLGSKFTQALVARRQQSFIFEASTRLDFIPQTFQQMAGLTCYYNSEKYYYLHVTFDPSLGRILEVTGCVENEAAQYFTNAPIVLPPTGEIELKAMVDHQRLRFAYRVVGKDWVTIAIDLDYSILSDEAGAGEHANFTGAFVGLCCQDLGGTNHPADFDYFHYHEYVS